MERRLGQAERLYDSHGKVFRLMWILVAVVVVAAGLAMVVFPGPVTIVVPAGLVMLAAVFGWARRLLMTAVHRGVHAEDRAEDASRPAQALAVAASACLGAAAVALLFLL